MQTHLRHWMTVVEAASQGLPDDVVEAFKALGSAQRGAPEQAMLRVQRIAGGGVLSALVEHVGDITHRMSHMAQYGTVLGREKVLKTLGWLDADYGFEREMKENIAANARYREVDAVLSHQQISTALRAYAAAHAALPVYNEAQYLARQAAVEVGKENFNAARQALRRLSALATTEETFTAHGLQFSRDQQGHLLPYQPATAATS
jgi:hypothetical protein